nr:unnamed protein product [Callosobruchus analis]
MDIAYFSGNRRKELL